jgi:hypothetical protein
VHRVAVGGRDCLAKRHILDARRGQIGPGKDSEHTGHAVRLRDIDRIDRAMRISAADHHRKGLSREIEIVAVAALAAQQHRVLVTWYRLTDGEFGEGKVVEIDTAVHQRTSIG